MIMGKTTASITDTSTAHGIEKSAGNGSQGRRRRVTEVNSESDKMILSAVAEGRSALGADRGEYINLDIK